MNPKSVIHKFCQSPPNACRQGTSCVNVHRELEQTRYITHIRRNAQVFLPLQQTDQTDAQLVTRSALPSRKIDA